MILKSEFPYFRMHEIANKMHKFAGLRRCPIPSSRLGHSPAFRCQHHSPRRLGFAVGLPSLCPWRRTNPESLGICYFVSGTFACNLFMRLRRPDVSNPQTEDSSCLRRRYQLFDSRSSANIANLLYCVCCPLCPQE